MSVLALLPAVLPAAEGHDIPFDDQGYTTEHWLLPPFWEMIISTAASLIVFALLWKFAWPVIKKSFNDRTARIQGDLDNAAAAKTAAATEAESIRAAKGDIEGERQRLLAEADTHAEALIADGRVRLQAEIVALEERADAEIAAAGNRGSDELRVEIARHSAAAIDSIVNGSLDASTHDELIENFIARVGAAS